MINLPDTSTLLPKRHTLGNGNTLYYMPSTATELVKIDLLHEAGSAYQPKLLCAAAAASLYTMASHRRNSAEVSEFIDYRGIIMENSPDLLVSSTTVYTLRRYLPELLPLIDELLREPAFAADDFGVYMGRRRQELMSGEQKSSVIARRMFYEALFGADHPLGKYATPADVDKLSLEDVSSYYAQRFPTGRMQVVLSGNVDDTLLATVDRLWGQGGREADTSVIESLAADTIQRSAILTQKIPGAVQTTIRIGRVLPLSWADMDYARFMILTTVLGGYFGSRLMSNIREDKGYTYGIYARTQIFRGCIVFYITADVAQGTADAAVEEVMKELERLRTEPVPEDELELVKTVLSADFIRSVDGIFEQSARLCDMLSTRISEQLTDNLREALKTTTAAQLQELAQRLLQRDDLTVCQAGF